MAWWKEMALHNSKAEVKPIYTVLQSFPGKQTSTNQRGYHFKLSIISQVDNLFL